VRDAETWDLVRTDTLPNQQLGESIALEPKDRSYLIGSEGVGSTLLRIRFQPDAATPSPTSQGTSSSPSPQDDEMLVPLRGVAVVGGVLALVVIGIMVARRRSRPS